MRARALHLLAGLAAGAAFASPALAQLSSYEPGQRLRTAMETCLKNETMNGAYCVRKCQPEFKMDVSRRPPVCVATRQGLRYDPPKVEWTPPDQKNRRPRDSST